MTPEKSGRGWFAFIAMILVLGACSSEPSIAEGVVSSTAPGSLGLDDPESAGTSLDGSGPTSTSNAVSTTATPVEDVPISDACVTKRNPEVGSQTGVVNSGGNEYDVLWTVPSSYDGTPVPLVADFHGLGSNGGQQNVFDGFGAVAEDEGFVVVHPTGLRNLVDERVSWELPQFDVDTRDDVAFVSDLIDFIGSQVCIDQERIFSVGMSNGAFFTSVLVCELSDRLAGAASVGGVTHPDSCDPARPVPYLAFHGTADTVVPYEGGGESTLAEADGGNPFFEQVMPEEFAEFADDFECGEFTDEVVTTEVSLRTWTGCNNDAQLGFYTIDGGGHTWPGSQVSAAFESLGVTNLDIDATRLIWDFFASRSRAA